MENALTKNRFFWGLLLAWTPWVPTMIGVGYLFIGINNSKATGLAAVAGGMAELLVWWGIAAMFVTQIAAIVWLFRSLSSSDLFAQHACCRIHPGQRNDTASLVHLPVRGASLYGKHSYPLTAI